MNQAKTPSENASTRGRKAFATPPLLRFRRRERRGIILVFVVVLLVLLAIMGTAYLATTRADLITIRGRGAGPNANAPLLVNRQTLDQVYSASQEHVKKILVADLVNLQNNGDLNALLNNANVSPAARRLFFRQTGPVGPTQYYKDYDAPGKSDPWLSSTLPEIAQTGTPKKVKWPWMSAPIADKSSSGAIEFQPNFADPRYVNGTSPIAIPATARVDRPLGAVRMTAQNASKTNRTYPGYDVSAVVSGFPDTTGFAIGGDADGDGINDSGLIPILINPGATGIDQYVDKQNGVIYYYAYRLVDNSSQINLGTALSMSADFSTKMQSGDSDSSDTDPHTDFPGETREQIAKNTRVGVDPNIVGPNFGFFRSNVGLIELIQEALAIYTGQANTYIPSQKELRRYVDMRFPELSSDPVGGAVFDQMRQIATAQTKGFLAPMSPVPPTTNGNSYVFRSFGDVLEQQVLKRPALPLGWYYGPAAGAGKIAKITTPGTSDLASLNDKGGTLLNPEIPASAVETALQLSVRDSTPNFTGRTDASWKWFPPDQVYLWFEWTKNLDGLRAASPPTTPNYFRYDTALFGSTGDGSFPSGAQAVDLQRSIRSVVTTHSGEGTVTPVRSDATGKPPIGMPVYPATAVPDLDAAPFGEYPAAKVSAATGTKRQLWRAFWSAMTTSPTQGAGAGDWAVEAGPAFLMGTRYTNPNSDDSISGRNMARIRSAIAACNAIDMRDSDDDITELDVQLEPEVRGSVTTNLVTRVFGTERQPFITEVLWADADGSGSGEQTYVAIEIYNPYDTDIDLSQFYIGVMSRSGNALNSGTRAMVAGTPVIHLDSATLGGGSTLLGPGRFAVIQTAAVPPSGIAQVNPPVGSSPLQYLGTLATTGQQFARDCGGNELVMARYRRFDGEITHNAIAAFSETAGPVANPDAMLTMVPIETIDMRYVVAPNNTDPVQFQYRRMNCDPADPTRASDRWRCVYGGQYFSVPAANANGADPMLRPTGPNTNPAWKMYAGTAASAIAGAEGVYTDGAHTLNSYEPIVPISPAPAGDDPNIPILAEPIQVQSFKPDPARHPIDRFPFGSPFARDGDVLDIPFIGAYQIFRVAGANYTLFEENSLSMDAFLAEPEPLVAQANPSIGRSDPRQASTAWAKDLLDFVTARQAPMHDFFPDVPKVVVLPNGSTEETATATDKLAYVGNGGPVRGINGGTLDTVNATQVPWISVDGAAYLREGVRLPNTPGLNESTALLQGKININTAPRPVLRMLASVVDPDTGVVTAANVANISTVVDAIVTQRNLLANAAAEPYGFESIFDLASIASVRDGAGTRPAIPTSPQLQTLGDLAGGNKPNSDYQFEMRNLTRISNLISTRSDVYTVYVTVQAWSYRPGVTGWTQATDTRLVAERRSSFVVDRSQVTPEKDLSTDSLLIFPIASE